MRAVLASGRWKLGAIAAGTVLAVPLIASALAPVNMGPGDTLHVHCDTTMSGTIAANDADLACATLSPSPTPGGTVTLNPIADSYTSASTPTVNFGTNVNLRVDSSPVLDSFLTFDLTGLSPTSETLRIWAETAQSTGFTVYAEPTAWSESGLTFANQPAFGAILGTSGPAAAGAWLSIPVTGGSFALDTPNTTTLRLSSREGGHPPELVVTQGGTPSPLPSPTTTATPSPATSTPSPTPIPTPTSTPSPTPTATPIALPIQHVVVVWLENHEATSVTASSMPYLTGLAGTYGTASSYFAVSHPSLPNYLAFWSGSTQGVSDDGTYNLGAVSLPNQMDTAGKSWRTFVQAYPASGCATGSTYPSRVDGPGTTASNARKHNPAMSFTYVSGNSTRCANIKPLSAFDPNVNLAFVVPNLCNDAHDCSLTVADNFLKAWVPGVFAAPDWAHTLLVVTFDEGTSSSGGGGHVYAMVARQGGHVSSATSHNHYGLLHTIENIFGLPCLANSCGAAALTEFLP
jgi:phosphatidylinositol-3-phosphatase